VTDDTRLPSEKVVAVYSHVPAVDHQRLIAVVAIAVSARTCASQAFADMAVKAVALVTVVLLDDFGSWAAPADESEYYSENASPAVPTQQCSVLLADM